MYNFSLIPERINVYGGHMIVSSGTLSSSSSDTYCYREKVTE